MTDTLTAAGVKLCMLLGTIDPTYDECDRALLSRNPVGDSFMHDGPANGFLVQLRGCGRRRNDP
jgi:hypothetical protein